VAPGPSRDALQDVPSDLVTPSASGLDPHTTVQNAKLQLDRISGQWARDLKRAPAELRPEIEQMLRERAFAPDAGLFIINAPQINLDLRKRYGASA
jgi:K+-transporting ATPase ATPase C chain